MMISHVFCTRSPSFVPRLKSPFRETIACALAFFGLSSLHIQGITYAQSSIRFAVIGDYGYASQAEQDVASLVKSWNPEFIITTGDNNYLNGADSTIDQNIGQYYHEFIFPYMGRYGQGDTVNRFFPSLGNHDWETPGATPYLNYFTMPGNERYYDFVRGPAHFFAIDSDEHEPDGDSATSAQASWLKARLSSSTAQWKLVYMHHPPYVSWPQAWLTPFMQWPYKEWGASAVLAGHAHLYERLVVDSLPYFVNGLGGRSIHPFGEPLPSSQVRYNADYGAMLVVANDYRIIFRFITRAGKIIDVYRIDAPYSVSMRVRKGWNILSLPVSVVDSREKIIFPTAISDAITYKEGHYDREDTLSPGNGYWVKFAAPDTINISGMVRPIDTISVQEGWNLAGSISFKVPVSTIAAEPPDILGSQFFFYNGRHIVVDTLRPGRGYWIKATAPGKIILKK